MAHETLNLVHIVPYGTDTARIQKALRFLPPQRFFVHQVQVDPQHRERVTNLLGDAKTSGIFSELEILGLCGLEVLPGADAAIAIQSSPVTYSSYLQSHYNIRAVLVEAQRKNGVQWKYKHSIPFVAEVTMPYWGTTGATDEQTEVTTAMLLKGLFTGWKSWSKRHSNSTLKRLKLV